MTRTARSAATAAAEEEAPAAVAVTYHAPYPAGYLHGPQCLTEAQRRWLLGGINVNRVSRLKERGGASYIEAYDVRAHLTRTFGFANWSEEVLEVVMVADESEPRQKEDKKAPDGIKRWTAWTVGYRATVRLTVSCPHGVPIASYTECAAEDGLGAQPSHTDAHHNALTAAVSTALKRAAINLGDQFGLSLYKSGATAPIVGGTLVEPPNEQAEQGGPRPDAHITAPLPRETDASRERVSVPYEGDDYPTAQ